MTHHSAVSGSRGLVALVHLQRRPDLRQFEAQRLPALPGLPLSVGRNPFVLDQPIQSRARDAKLPHNRRCADHFFLAPHAPSVAVLPIVPLVPSLGALVQLVQMEQSKGGAYVTGRPAPKRARKQYGAVKLRLRFRVLERDGFRCHYCGVPAREMHLQIDHVMPFSKGGADEPSNYVASCSNCNGGKGDVILEQRDGD
jgi:hypothetical protein